MVTAESGENKDKTSERNVFNIYSAIIIIIILSITIALLILFVGLYLLFGLYTPFFKVASDSMTPTLQVDDTIIVSSLVRFSDLKIGDIIVFYSPSNNDKLTVHRVIERFEIPNSDGIDVNETIIRTLGDANTHSIYGLDYPIREHNYIGKVVYHISYTDYLYNILRPPLIHIIILAVLTSILSTLLYSVLKKKKEKK